MATGINRRWMLKQRPQRLPGPECYEWREEPVPRAGENEVVIRNLYMSLDPAIRGWMDDRPSYLPPIPLGGVMRATTIGKVLESRCAGFERGDIVQGLNGWEDYSVSQGRGFTARVPVHPGLPLTDFLSVLGTTGLSAYFGLLEVARPRAGETVLVTGAAGAVGSIVGQLARRAGCRAVGVAGSDEKCAWLERECGYDATINYRTRANDLVAAIRAACPDGVDIQFENVGGGILEAGLECLNKRGRVLLCGLISQYNAGGDVRGIRNLWQLIAKTARIEGFLVRDWLDRWAEAAAELAKLVAAGELHHREHIERGLEHAPETFLRLFDGNHQGKLIVDIAGNEA
jgi:NADPH-dependent curcumin reductase CurA